MAAEHEANNAHLLPQGGETIEQDMLVEEGAAVPDAVVEPQAEENVEGGAKRAREEGEEGEKKNEDAKRARMDESAENKEISGGGEDEGQKEPAVTTAILGPKVFDSAVTMFDYFFKLLHFWSPNLDLNKYEHMVLLDLLNKGHPEPDKKMGEGVQAVQVRYHPIWKSRCFFIVREDGTSDDFSFRKCVDNILPLPENMKSRSASDQSNPFKDKNQKGGGRGGRGAGGRGGWGRGRRGGRFGR